MHTLRHSDTDIVLAHLILFEAHFKGTTLSFFLNFIIYILCVLTEKPYCNSMERHVIYIQITTSSHVTFNDVKINYGSLQSDWTLFHSSQKNSM